MSVSPDGGMPKAGIPIADIAGGMFAAYASWAPCSLANAIERRGQYADTTMLGSQIALLTTRQASGSRPVSATTDRQPSPDHRPTTPSRHRMAAPTSRSATTESGNVSAPLGLTDAASDPASPPTPTAPPTAPGLQRRERNAPTQADRGTGRAARPRCRALRLVHDIERVFNDPGCTIRDLVMDLPHATLGEYA